MVSVYQGLYFDCTLVTSLPTSPGLSPIVRGSAFIPINFLHFLSSLAGDCGLSFDVKFLKPLVLIYLFIMNMEM